MSCANPVHLVGFEDACLVGLPAPPTPAPPPVPVQLVQPVVLDAGPAYAGLVQGVPLALFRLLGAGSVTILGDGAGSRSLTFTLVADGVRVTTWNGADKIVAAEAWATSLDVLVTQTAAGRPDPETGPALSLRGLLFTSP